MEIVSEFAMYRPIPQWFKEMLKKPLRKYYILVPRHYGASCFYRFWKENCL